MTPDPHQPISFPAACREAASKVHANDCRFYSPPDFVCNCNYAAALRELATRIERLIEYLPPMPDGYALTDVGAREFLPPTICMDFAAALAAGYRPPGQENT